MLFTHKLSFSPPPILCEMLKNPPKITIAITCYNAESTIERAIHSAFRQNWPNFEIVVVDDCSTDGSKEKLTLLAQQDSRLFVVHHQQNLGVGAARNTLLSESKGEFIAFFDDDDESLPERLTQQYDRISEYEKHVNSDLIVSYAARTQVFPDGSSRYEPTVGMDVTPGPSGNDMADLILIGRPLKERGGSCATCSLMAKREVFEKLQGFNPTLRRGEDTDFNLRLALMGGHFAGVSSPLVIQYMTISEDKEFSEERRNVLNWIEIHRDYLERKTWYAFSVHWFTMKFDYLEGKKIRFLRNILLLLFLYPFKMIKRLSWSLPNINQYRRAKNTLDVSNGS